MPRIRSYERNGCRLTVKNNKYYFFSILSFFQQVMNGKQDNTQGGALIFITDGKQDCDGGIDIDDENVINRIIKTKVRIITVAFGLVTFHLN